MAARLRLLCIAAGLSSPACIDHTPPPLETKVLRGELDRQEWTIHVCASDEDFGVVFPSALMEEYLRMEQALGVAPSDPVFAVLTVTPIPTSINSPDAVGVLKVNKLDRGSCGGVDEALGL